MPLLELGPHDTDWPLVLKPAALGNWLAAWVRRPGPGLTSLHTPTDTLGGFQRPVRMEEDRSRSQPMIIFFKLYKKENPWFCVIGFFVSEALCWISVNGAP